MSKKGIIYVMTTTVSGLIKIGQAETIKNYNERMRGLIANGYSNVTGLKKYFAIEVKDYSAKEKLLHQIFDKHRVGVDNKKKKSELFVIDQDLVRQLLLSFAGEVIYDETKEKKDTDQKFSFYKKGLKNGDKISFKSDETVVAIVNGEREVEYKGKTSRLSTLTREIYENKNQLNKSGAYQGARYWKYKGKLLIELPDKK